MTRQGGALQGVYQEPLNPFGTHLGIDLPAGVYTLNVPQGAQRAMIQALAQNIYYTLDGSTPTATNGFILVANAVPIIIDVGKNVTPKFQEGAGGAYLQLQYLD